MLQHASIGKSYINKVKLGLLDTTYYAVHDIITFTSVYMRWRWLVTFLHPYWWSLAVYTSATPSPDRLWRPRECRQSPVLATGARRITRLGNNTFCTFTCNQYSTIYNNSLGRGSLIQDIATCQTHHTLVWWISDSRRNLSKIWSVSQDPDAYSKDEYLMDGVTIGSPILSIWKFSRRHIFSFSVISPSLMCDIV